jgi:hypothetical protein
MAACRAWLFNILALGLAVGASFKATRHYQKKRKGKTVQDKDSVSHRQQVISGRAGSVAGIDVADETLTELQMIADHAGSSSLSWDSTVSKQSQQEQGLNESLPGQLESPERPPRVAAGCRDPDPTVNPAVTPFSGRVATQGKLVLPPLRLSRKTGAAYYVDEDGKSVWASALPPPPDSLLAADGSPWRDVYHTGPHNATHIDNLQREDKLPESEAP